MDLNKIILDAGRNKVKAIQILRNYTTLSLKDAKGIIDQAYEMKKTNPEYDANVYLYHHSHHCIEFFRNLYNPFKEINPVESFSLNES